MCDSVAVMLSTPLSIGHLHQPHAGNVTQYFFQPIRGTDRLWSLGRPDLIPFLRGNARVERCCRFNYPRQDYRLSFRLAWLVAGAATGRGSPRYFKCIAHLSCLTFTQPRHAVVGRLSVGSDGRPDLNINLRLAAVAALAGLFSPMAVIIMACVALIPSAFVTVKTFDIIHIRSHGGLGAIANDVFFNTKVLKCARCPCQ